MRKKRPGDALTDREITRLALASARRWSRPSHRKLIFALQLAVMACQEAAEEVHECVENPDAVCWACVFAADAAGMRYPLEVFKDLIFNQVFPFEDDGTILARVNELIDNQVAEADRRNDQLVERLEAELRAAGRRG